MKGDLAKALHQALTEEFKRAAGSGPVAVWAREDDFERIVARMFEIAHTDPCFVKAGADEPIFVLRAKDLLAPRAVRYWFKLLSDATPDGDDWHRVYEAKGREAFDHADRMQKWGETHGAKVPD